MKFVYLADRPEFISDVASWNYNQWGYLQAENSYNATIERLQNKLNRDKLPLPVIALDADDNIIASAQLKRYEIDTWPERGYWLGINRRLAKDFEKHEQTVLTLLYTAMIKLMSRRLARYVEF